MKVYVVGLVVDKSGSVILIRKNRPDWQEGRLNGVGGKVELGETPYEAMVRECTEECGLHLQDWQPLGTVTNELDYIVYYYIAETPELSKARAVTDEEIEVWSLYFLDMTEVIPPTDVFLRVGLNPQYKQIHLVEKNYE